MWGGYVPGAEIHSVERALLKFDMLKSTLFNDVVMDDMASLA